MSRILSLGTLSCAALLLVAAPLHADTIKVPKDFETIQAAIAEAAEGDTISVSKGVYVEQVTVGVAIILKGSGAVIDGNYDGTCLTITAPGVEVSGFTLVNGGGLPPIEGDPTGGVHVTATGTGAELTKLTISACESFGILMETTGTIASCKIDACPGSGIEVVTNNPGNSTVTVIEKNTVTRCGQGMELEDGPFEVTSNTVEGCSGTGIELDMEAVIEGGATASAITKNKCNENGGTGLDVNAELLGVDTLVEKNTCDDNAIGLTLSGQDLDAQSNTVTDNTDGGILVLASSSVLNKNKVQGNGAIGIFVGQGAVEGGGLGENQLTSNTVQDNGGDGVRLVSGANTLSKNTVKDNEGDGIDINVGADDNILVDNTVQNNQHDGIDNSGLTTTLNGNKVKGCDGAAIAGAGDGAGTVNSGSSADNTVDDDSDIETWTTPGQLEMETFFP